MSELSSFLENKNKLESHKRVCENKDFCNVIMGSEDNKILEFNQRKNSDKAPFFIYANLKFITEKIEGWKNNPENSSTAKVTENILSVFSMSSISKKSELFVKTNLKINV